MSKLVIKDLNESKDLDREAMRTIVGGSYRGTRHMANYASNLTATQQPGTLLGDLLTFRFGSPPGS